MASGSIEGVYHINIVCRDFERSFAWYTDVLGMRAIEGPMDAGGPLLRGVARGAEMWGVETDDLKVRFAILAVGDNGQDGPLIDLMEWVQPRSYGAPHATLHEVGIARIALKVSDIRAVHDDLVSKGVEFMTGPVVMAPTDDGGALQYCCFYDPDGAILELWGPGPMPEESS